MKRHESLLLEAEEWQAFAARQTDPGRQQLAQNLSQAFRAQARLLESRPGRQPDEERRGGGISGHSEALMAEAQPTVAPD